MRLARFVLGFCRRCARYRALEERLGGRLHCPVVFPEAYLRLRHMRAALFAQELGQLRLRPIPLCAELQQRLAYTLDLSHAANIPEGILICNT